MIQRFSTLMIGILLLSACAGRPQPGAAANVQLTVFAAASLKETFTALAQKYQANNPKVSITFNFAGSQELAQQITNGAPADIFASAALPPIQAVEKAGLISAESTKPLAYNKLVIIFPAANPGKIQAIQDLGKAGLKIVLAAKEVPVGNYSLEFLAKADQSAGFPATFEADVLKNVVSYEDNVKSVLTKVELGEADAGIVYTTDLAAASGQGIHSIEIPGALNVQASYTIAPVATSRHLAEAQKFVDFILSPAGQEILKQYGFITAQ